MARRLANRQGTVILPRGSRSTQSYIISICLVQSRWSPGRLSESIWLRALPTGFGGAIRRRRKPDNMPASLGARPKCLRARKPKGQGPRPAALGRPLRISSRKKNKTKRTQTPRGSALPREGSSVQRPLEGGMSWGSKSGGTPEPHSTENTPIHTLPLEGPCVPKQFVLSPPRQAREGRRTQLP